MQSMTADNHFVPQFYLNAWGTGGKAIHVYETLVPDARMPDWREKPIRGQAKRLHLYTLASNLGSDADEFERWIKRAIEDPVLPTLEKLRQERPLTENDWERLVYFLASQDLRTPTSYLQFSERWQAQMPALLAEVLSRPGDDQEIPEDDPALNMLQESAESNPETLTHPSPFRITLYSDPLRRQSYLQAGALLGRRLWIESIRLLLRPESVRVLLQHSWSVLRPCPGEEWITSDHPVIRLNHWGDRFDFDAKWASSRSEIFFPLSPTHLMYAQVGVQHPKDMTCDRDQTLDIQRFSSLRAYRSIYARQPCEQVRRFRARIVDAAASRQEADAWKHWHSNQSSAERDFQNS